MLPRSSCSSRRFSPPRGRSSAASPPVGARVEVRYDQADPSRWTLPAEGTAFWRLFSALGALFVAMGLGFALVL
ncbi:DUF3592 domain-containing protein [Streptomyces sp. NBC_01006]|uniref:DUF3592 domain-containing protein n=1 Tax=Streptomyces sp. NBC_01006 TaxID=2903716 RepID=UPI00386BB778